MPNVTCMNKNKRTIESCFDLGMWTLADVINGFLYCTYFISLFIRHSENELFLDCHYNLIKNKSYSIWLASCNLHSIQAVEPEVLLEMTCLSNLSALAFALADTNLQDTKKLSIKERFEHLGCIYFLKCL